MQWIAIGRTQYGLCPIPGPLIIPFAIIIILLISDQTISLKAAGWGLFIQLLIHLTHTF